MPYRTTREELPPLPVTETMVIELTSEWQEIGTGKLIMYANVPGVRFAIGDMTPTLPTGTGFPTPNDDIIVVEAMKSKVWAKLAADQYDGQLTFVNL